MVVDALEFEHRKEGGITFNTDGTGEIGVFMFWAPREDIRPGDRVEAAGSLRVGYTKKQNIWGIKMAKLSGGTKIK